jgi:AcrR family transcriptional regulator
VTSVKSGARRQRAAHTRLRIIRAAHEEFLRHGYHGATIAAVARRAGVATQTVYFVFHTKAELISAVIDTAVLGEDDPTPPEATGWWRAMQVADSAPDALRHFVRGAAPRSQRAAGISELLRAAALTDPEVHARWEHHDRLQVEAFGRVIDTVAAKGQLRPGLDRDTATAVLITVFGDSTYHLLTAERGWSHDQVVDWYCDGLPGLLPDSTSHDPVRSGRTPMPRTRT